MNIPYQFGPAPEPRPVLHRYVDEAIVGAPAPHIHIRWMIRRDMIEVLDIERASFGDAAWTERQFLAALGDRDVIGMVAEVGDRVVGFMLYRLGTAHIELLDFAVAPDRRRRGVGRQMAAKLAGKLSAVRRTYAEAVVPGSATAAHLFWRSCGWRAVRVDRACYGPDHEDAYIFRRLVEPGAGMP